MFIKVSQSAAAEDEDDNDNANDGAEWCAALVRQVPQFSISVFQLFTSSVITCLVSCKYFIFKCCIVIF